MPGPIGICPVLIQEAGEVFVKPPIRIIRASLINGHVPEAWSETRMVFNPNQEKEDMILSRNSGEDYKI